MLCKPSSSLCQIFIEWMSLQIVFCKPPPGSFKPDLCYNFGSSKAFHTVLTQN